jgi:hypothetical protein
MAIPPGKNSVPADRFYPGPGEHRSYGPFDKGAVVHWLANIGCRDSLDYLYAVPLEIADAGRRLSRRSRQRSDCTVVALAHASGVPYDTCYDALALGGRKSGRGFHIRRWAVRQEAWEGWRFEWRDFPATKGFPRVTPVTFALANPKGRFILQCAGHVLACVDGVIYDSFRPRADACVYGAVELKP